jgi:nucleotide-binding universal stress UspA family protein
MYHHIMVPLDGSKLAECVIPHAEAIAKGCVDVTVSLVRVSEPLKMYGGLETRFTPEELRPLEEDSMKVAGDYLEPLVGQLKSEGIKARAVVLHGNVVESLVDFGKQQDVDLLIIATHGRSGVSRWAWGSVADRVLRSACMPVVMVRAPGCAPGF